MAPKLSTVAASVTPERPLVRVATLPVRAADRLRWVWLRALGPLARPLVRDRELRVAAAGVTMLLAALALTAVVPLWLLALGPIVWGVPHVLADVRYLWVRPGHHRNLALWIVAGVPLLILSFTSQPMWGLSATAGALLVARGSIARKLIGLTIVCPLIVVSWWAPFVAAVAFAHAHNLIGVGFWWSWRRRRGWLHTLPLVVFAAGSALILFGGLDPIVAACSSLDGRAGGVDLWGHLATLAPDLPVRLGMRLVLFFAFAQSAHYAVWVRLVPEEDRGRETPRTFAASLRALRADLGWPVLAIAIAAALGLAVWAAFDLFAARVGYLRAILFHGHLEMAAAALLFVAGARPRTASDAA